MEIRSLLEIYNIEKIVTKIDDKFVHLLEENLAEQAEAIADGTYNDFIEKDREFHLLLASYSGNNELKKMIKKMNTGVNRAFIILSKTVPQSAQSAYEEHADIIKALKAKDTVLAKNTMHLHLANVEKRFLEGMKLDK